MKKIILLCLLASFLSCTKPKNTCWECTYTVGVKPMGSYSCNETPIIPEGATNVKCKLVARPTVQ